MRQFYGYTNDDQKRTAREPDIIRFLNSLSVGAIVFEQREEYDVSRREWQTVSKAVGVVAAGPFGDNVFEQRAKWF